MGKFKHKYSFCISFGAEHHSWTCVGRDGAMQLNIRQSLTDGDYHGGLEQHRRHPTENDGAPDHEDCHVLHGPCWHDGTSLYVSETLAPLWRGLRGSPDEHRRMFSIMEREYERRFAEEGVVMRSRAEIEAMIDHLEGLAIRFKDVKPEHIDMAFVFQGEADSLMWALGAEEPDYAAIADWNIVSDPQMVEIRRILHAYPNILVTHD